MKIDKLIVTQCGLRNIDQLSGMINFVKNGGYFTTSSLEEYSKETGLYQAPLIKLAVFNDVSETKKNPYVEDGHHRIISCLLGGRETLREDEYEVVFWDTINDFLDINFDCNWVTPYDPRIEFRYPDYSIFKDEVQKHLNDSPESAIKYIRANGEKYKCPRKYKQILELILDLTDGLLKQSNT